MNALLSSHSSVDRLQDAKHIHVTYKRIKGLYLIFLEKTNVVTIKGLLSSYRVGF